MKKINKLLAIFAVSILLPIAGCGGGGQSQSGQSKTESSGVTKSSETSGDSKTSGEVEVTDIQIRGTGYEEGEDFIILRGKTVTLAATVLPNNATHKTVEWTTSNPDIGLEVKSETSVKITGWDICTSTITAKAGNFTKTFTAKCVDEIDPESVSVNIKDVHVQITKTADFEVTVLPEDCTDKRVTFSVLPLDDAQQDMVKVKEENGRYFVQAENLAAPNDCYQVVVRCVANNEISCKFNVTVDALPLESIEFEKDSVDLYLDSPQYRLLPKFSPEESTYRELTFTSSNPSAADVDVVGNVIPKAIGKTTITATSVTYPEISDTIDINIVSGNDTHIMRLLDKKDVEVLSPVSYDIMDFETDKVAFNAWKKVLSEDCNTSSHISDAGWAIWMVGFDTFDDDQLAEKTNAMVYCKMNVPASATEMQFVFRAHPFPDDRAKFRISLVKEDYTLVRLCGWTTFSNTVDQAANINVGEYAGTAVTFVVEQDQIGNKPAGNYMGVSLMYRRCLFNVESAAERYIQDEAYFITLAPVEK